MPQHKRFSRKKLDMIATWLFVAAYLMPTASEAARIVEVSPAAAENIVFGPPDPAMGPYLFANPPIDLFPYDVYVTENSDISLPGVTIQAGAAWFPSYGGVFEGDQGRITKVNWEVLVDGEAASAGSLEVKGVPTEQQWYNFHDGEGDYPYGTNAFTNDHRRFTFDIRCEAEAFEEGVNGVQFKTWGRTFVATNKWSPDSLYAYGHLPWDAVKLDPVTTIHWNIRVLPPYTVWKSPAYDEAHLPHQAVFTVDLHDRNLARGQYKGNLQTYEDPTILTPGSAGLLGPGAQQIVRSETHAHNGLHPPVEVRVLPDFAPISVGIVHRRWDLEKNRGKEYRRIVPLTPTILYCRQDGDTSVTPAGLPDAPTGLAPGHGHVPRRTVKSPAGAIVPQAGAGEAKGFQGNVRVHIVSLLLGNPTLDVDATADENDEWICTDCVESGDEVELQYAFRDRYGRHYEDTIALTVPDSLDLAAPDTLEIPQPLLVPAGADVDPGGSLTVDVRVYDLAGLAFDTMQPLPDALVEDAGSGFSGHVDSAGHIDYDVPHGVITRISASDSDGRFLPLQLPPSPPLEINLTHHQTESGQWRDDRVYLWLTPSFAEGRLHAGSGFIDSRDGELFSRVGAVSNIAPADVVGAVWETLDGQPLLPAVARPWGANSNDDYGYVPALFALAPPAAPGKGLANKSDPAFQAILQAVVGAGGARLRVHTGDGLEHVVDIPLQMDFTSGVDTTPQRRELDLQVVPNPFNPSTTISFALPEAGPVRLEILGLDGRHVATLIDRNLEAGSQSATWHGRDERGAEMASGVYLARLRTANTSQVQKLVLIR